MIIRLPHNHTLNKCKEPTGGNKEIRDIELAVNQAKNVCISSPSTQSVRVGRTKSKKTAKNKASSHKPESNVCTYPSAQQVLHNHQVFLPRPYKSEKCPKKSKVPSYGSSIDPRFVHLLSKRPVIIKSHPA
jgi:hypothetical protein